MPSIHTVGSPAAQRDRSAGICSPSEREQSSQSLPTAQDLAARAIFFIVSGQAVAGQDLPGQLTDVGGIRDTLDHSADIDFRRFASGGREVVTTYGALELPPQHLNEDLGAAGLIDAKQHIQIRPEDPGPE